MTIVTKHGSKELTLAKFKTFQTTLRDLFPQHAAELVAALPLSVLEGHTDSEKRLIIRTFARRALFGWDNP